ncbi:MAG: hypothetical protein ABSC94_31795 [Polyangiaceae bacterium]
MVEAVAIFVNEQRHRNRLGLREEVLGSGARGGIGRGPDEGPLTARLQVGLFTP